MTDENKRKMKFYFQKKDNLSNNSNSNLNSQKPANQTIDSFHSNIQPNAINYITSYQKDEHSPKEIHPFQKINKISSNNLTISNYNNKKEKSKKIGNEVKKFDYIYSPRTTFIFQKEEEEKLYQDLGVGFDPITIKIMKSYFKEKLGILNELEFICLLKNHLLTWHPEIPNREEILVKLLSRLFQDIDLNCNKEMNWDEFTDYLMSSSKNVSKEKLNYDLKLYKHSNYAIDDINYNDLISYAFYIEKYNLIGTVIENKSIINFYDAENFKRVKAYIDVKTTQRDIDQMQMKEFDVKAKAKIKKEKEESIKKLLIHQEHLLKRNLIKKIDILKTNNIVKKVKRVETPEKLRNEIKKINTNLDFEKKKKEFNRKLTILTTCFVNDLDLLFVSSSNNKISAWKFINGEFLNVNQLEEEIKEKTNFSCAILNSILPQYTMDWEPIQKQLYSGQADGKILLWDISKSKNLDYYTLDFKKAKDKHDEEMLQKNKNLRKYNSFEKFRDISFSEFSLNNNKKDFDKRDKQDLLFSMGEKMLLNIKSDMARDSVSCIKVLGKMQILAAGYYNGNIILWDTLLHEYRKFYTDQTTGIYQIEYNINKNIIYTCGFDHNIHIYDPFIDGHCIQKLEGHNWSINSISCDRISNELISIDINGNIKVWDLNNYYNFQSININETIHLIKIPNINNQLDISKRISSNQKMIFLNKENKIFTYGEKLMVFSRETSYFPELCDSQAILGCFYNPRLYLFYTVCLKKIKIWNLLNGKLYKAFEEFLSNKLIEITSFCTDKIINKLYIGDNFGNIICLNLNYGNILKQYSSHKREIISISHSTKDNLLISLSIDNVLKIHKDKEFDDNSVIKEFELESLDITTINLSEEYSRLILGTKQGEIKYYDIVHLKQDSSLRNSDYKKIYRNDSITSTFIFEGYPLCLACHESCRNIFEIIPPHPYKFTFFGEFINEYKRIGSDDTIQTKIISFVVDKNNNKIYIGDILGYVICYSIKKLFDLFDNNKILNDCDGDDYNKKEENKIDEKYKKIIFENFHIEYLYCFQCHKEPIKHLLFINLSPSLIITTGNDRKVKLFSENGNYIDEFKQSTEKIKEIPIGIKYYFSDPFISKRNESQILQAGNIYRKDLDNFRRAKNRMILNKMRLENKAILEYSNKITEFNAQERLYLITKNCKLPKDRSTPWNYLPNLKLIEEEEKKNLKAKIDQIKKIEKSNQIFNSYESIYNEKHQPEFIKDMDEQKIKEFGELLNNKIRKVKLAISKLKLDSIKYNNYEIEKKRADNINYKNEIKLIYGKKIKKQKFSSPRLKLYNRERYTIYGINRKRYKSPNERFDNYQEQFNRNFFELENTLTQKLHKNFNYSYLNKNIKNENFQNSEYIKFDNINKIKKFLLPSLNNSPIRRKNMSQINKFNISRKKNIEKYPK